MSYLEIPLIYRIFRGIGRYQHWCVIESIALMLSASMVAGGPAERLRVNPGTTGGIRPGGRNIFGTLGMSPPQSPTKVGLSTTGCKFLILLVPATGLEPVTPDYKSVAATRRAQCDFSEMYWAKPFWIESGDSRSVGPNGNNELKVGVALTRARYRTCSALPQILALDFVAKGSVYAATLNKEPRWQTRHCRTHCWLFSQ